MDIYVINWIDQFCDYDTKLNLRQINRVCHRELPQLMFKLNDYDPSDPKPLSYVLTLSPYEIANVSLIYGWERLLRYAIKVGFTDWNWGLYVACRYGHESLVNLLIKYGANDWNRGLYGACQGGHESLVDLLIKYGAIIGIGDFMELSGWA